MNYCYAITGVFVPTNMPMSLLSYKYLRGLNMPVDVVAMNHTVDQSLVEKLSKDPKYKNMHVAFKGQYNDALFSIHNINLFKALKNEAKQSVDIYRQDTFLKSILESFDIQEQHDLMREVMDPGMLDMFVTPKDIDETIGRISFTISEAINGLCHRV